MAVLARLLPAFIVGLTTFTIIGREAAGKTIPGDFELVAAQRRAGSRTLVDKHTRSAKT